MIRRILERRKRFRTDGYEIFVQAVENSDENFDENYSAFCKVGLADLMFLFCFGLGVGGDGWMYRRSLLRFIFCKIICDLVMKEKKMENYRYLQLKKNSTVF